MPAGAIDTSKPQNTKIPTTQAIARVGLNFRGVRDESVVEVKLQKGRVTQVCGGSSLQGSGTTRMDCFLLAI